MSKEAFVRVNIVVEGHTEEEFVNRVLAPHLAQLGVYVAARRVLTSRQGPSKFRGGMTTYAKARHDVSQWLSQDQSAYVSTFFDLYALPAGFPQYAEAAGAASGAARATRLETAFVHDIDSPRFFPHIQPYEFEALLFSDPRAIDSALQLLSPGSRFSQLTAMVVGLETPEELNDNPVTAPSKRLLSLYPAYDKRLFGPLIAEEIGLQRIRLACPHFNEWLSRLESLVEDGHRSR